MKVKFVGVAKERFKEPLNKAVANSVLPPKLN
jgi:hypothetical protein